MALLQFRSKAAGAVLMLSATFEQVCSEAGIEAGSRGCWTPEELPCLVAAVEAALEREKPLLEARRRAVEDCARKAWQEQDEGETEKARLAEKDFVSLAMRVQPLLDMLKKSRRKGCCVTWGVP